MSNAIRHLTTDEIDAGMLDVLRSPKDEGVLRMIVRRPAINGREVLREAELDAVVGLVGDTWNARSSRRTADGSPHPEMHRRCRSQDHDGCLPLTLSTAGR